MRAVDDKSSGFSKTRTGWQVQSTGWKKRSLSISVRRDSSYRWGTWSTQATPGWYDVYVRFPRRNATTRHATYRILTADGTRKKQVDQHWWSTNHPGTWIRLGTYRFDETAAVRLSDRTGERRASGRRVVFDAVKFVPTGEPVITTRRRDEKPQASRDAAPESQPAHGSEPEPVREPAPTREPEPDREPKPAQEPKPAPELEPSPGPALPPEPEPEPAPPPEAA